MMIEWSNTWLKYTKCNKVQIQSQSDVFIIDFIVSKLQHSRTFIQLSLLGPKINCNNFAIIFLTCYMQLFLGALMIQVLLINDFTLLYKQEHYDKKLFSCISFNMTNFMQKIHCTCIMPMYEKTVFCTSMDTIQLCGQNNIQLNVFSDLSKHKREMAML